MQKRFRSRMAFVIIATLAILRAGLVFAQDEPAAPDTEEDTDVTEEMVDRLCSEHAAWKLQQKAMQSSADDPDSVQPMFFIGKKYRYCAVCPDHATRTNRCRSCSTRGIGGEGGRVGCGIQNPGCSIKFGKCNRYNICKTGR